MRDNYQIQMAQAKARFLTYDQAALLRKTPMDADERYFYPVMLGARYRLCRKSGDLEKWKDGRWRDANTFGEVMTLLDLFCDSKAGRCLSGRWKAMHQFGLQFHRNLLEDSRNPLARRFDREPERMKRACEALGGVPVDWADIGYRIALFEELPIGIQFWHGDEEFAPRLRYLWDENALDYIRYETMYYAVGMLEDALTAVK